MDSRRNDFKSPYRKALSKFSIELFKKSKNFPTSRESEKGAMGRKAFILGAGLGLIVSGIFLTFTWESILESQVNKEFILTDKSKTYEAWKKTRVEVYLKFFFWNWTNADEIDNPDFKPVLVEVGPYAYREITEKVNVVWNANGTVTYQRRRRWYFDQDRSNGTEDDLISSLDIVAQSSAFMTRYKNGLLQFGLKSTMAGVTIDTVKPVRSLLFEGYEHKLITAASYSSWLTQTKVPYDRFGWFYQRNGSSEPDGVFNIETGANGMEDFGKVRSWNYNNRTKFFDDECGTVRGSGGDFWPPKRKRDDIIELFSPDLCRYVTFRYKRDEVIHGMTGYRYETRATLLDNGANEEGNSCFCGGECPPPGALNVSTCRHGAPAFVTFPHFYLADPQFANSVVGMKPDPARHGAHITLEPTYGIPLDVAARFQINILVLPYENFPLYKGAKPIYFPVMWFEQTAYIPADTVKAVGMLLLLPTIGMSVAAILIVLGTALVLAAIIMKCCISKKQITLNNDVIRPSVPMLSEDFKERDTISDVIKTTAPMLPTDYHNKESESRWDTKF